MITRLHNGGVMAAVITLLAGVLSVASINTSDAATSSLRFSKVYYDSPGSDSASNTSLNAEWIRIKNFSTTTKKYLTGWTVRDKSGHVYKFGTFALVPGASVTLYTGKGSNSSTKRYWGLSNYVWNNSGDTAYLRSSNGTLMDNCAWSSVGAGYKTC